MEVKVEIVSKTTVKPSSSTPNHLKTYKFSIFDQLFPHVYVPLLFYYPDEQAELDPAEMSQKLKCSLSQVLTHFYPLAGRIKDNLSVQCTDEGVEFIETLIDCSLLDILKIPDPVLFLKLLPNSLSSIEASTGCLLMVQANFFKEGGLVIGLRISHKIADTSTLSSFVNAWAGLAAESQKFEFPIFGASTMFPPIIDNTPTLYAPELLRSNGAVVTRRYVVNAAMIAALKLQAATELVSNPTSVEVVSALIWKCVTKASRKQNYSMKMKPCMLHVPVNLRKRLDPPLPDSFVGNLASFFIAQINDDEHELGLKTLVTRIREGKYGMRHYIEQLSGENGSMATRNVVEDNNVLMMKHSFEFYLFTSWCRFPFYQVEFGWGKPRWVSVASYECKNQVVLIDAPDTNGIEAWVTLDEETMAIFDRHDQLLQFAILNPSII